MIAKPTKYSAPADGSSAGGGSHTWLLKLGPAAPLAELGGKARSLVKLAAVGLRTPRGFVVKDALFRALLGGAAVLEAGADGAAEALLAAPWPGGFLAELGAALSALAANGRVDVIARFAVRSSFADEDDADALAAGVYASELFVGAADVPGAVRRVLASALAPGARAYATRVGRPLAAAPVAVLIHPYVEATFHGSIALSSVAGDDVRIEVGAEHEQARARDAREGPAREAPGGNAPALPDALARALRAGVEAAARQLGSADLEWAASGDVPVFLQWRPDTRRRGSADAWSERLRAHEIDSAWVWDAAHNPAPLSPAQAGLVAMAAGACRLPFRMDVVDGYLFYGPPRAQDGPNGQHGQKGQDGQNGQNGTAAAVPAGAHAPAAPPGSRLRSATDAETFWKELSRDLTERVDAWREDERGPGDAVDGLLHALHLYLDGYEKIFGRLQPWLSEARRELRVFLEEHASGPEREATVARQLAALLSGVPSVATERRRLATAWARAETEPAREVARAAYLARFGEESSTWDVAVPTWRERPPASLPLGRPVPPVSSSPLVEEAAEMTGGGSVEKSISEGLPVDARARFQALLAAARLAVALGEADDALFARLQAVVRSALLALGRALHAQGALHEEEDVFFLAWPMPLTQGCALVRPALAVSSASATSARSELATAAAEARRCWRASHATPPPAAWASPPHLRGAGSVTGTSSELAGTRGVFRGLAGSPGRAVGRVHLHGAPGVLGDFDRAGADEPRVVVATTLLPTELPLVEAVALVTETGGALGHVAAQARERGMPAVVSLTAATRLLAAGTRVLVDGDRGLVTVLDEPAT